MSLVLGDGALRRKRSGLAVMFCEQLDGLRPIMFDLLFHIGGWCNGSVFDSRYTKLIQDFYLKQVKEKIRTRHYKGKF